MAYALIDSVEVGGNGPTASIDTTGADLLLLHITEYGFGTHGAPSDSKSNSWTELTSVELGDSQSTWYYAENPTVGSGHTASHTSDFPSIQFYAFSGADTSAPFDQENGATGDDVEALQTGSVTPTEDNELIVAGLTLNSSFTGPAINSSFTLELHSPYQPGLALGGCSAYLIQTSATSVNPQWTWSIVRDAAATIATFKVAGGAGPERRWILGPH